MTDRSPSPATRRRAPVGLLVLLGLFGAGCTRDLWRAESTEGVALTTSGPWASMIYLARTDSGVLAVDLGWVGAERALRRGLARLHATPSDVRWVFLTHAHRDHTYGWPLVRGARFVLGVAEVPYFTGTASYSGFLPRIGERMVSSPRPAPADLDIVALGGDSAFVLGKDTLFAFAIPGHTAGSTAYLFRGVLFAGDAINWRPWTGFRGTRREFSDDVARSRQSIQALWSRLDPARVKVACSSHAKCGTVDAAFRAMTGK